MICFALLLSNVEYANKKAYAVTGDWIADRTALLVVGTENMPKLCFKVASWASTEDAATQSLRVNTR